MVEKKQKNSIDKMSFEEAIKELTDIVSKIEQGEIPLQDSLTQYEKGMALIKHCRGILQKAEKRIEKISEGEPKTQEEPEAKTQKEIEDIPF
ncbi:MAG: exodeoxyribonuclease VII small subunit [Planctomycetota bacterium]|jgi:exodeoxyribonuclease VII small subunit